MGKGKRNSVGLEDRNAVCCLFHPHLASFLVLQELIVLSLEGEERGEGEKNSTSGQVCEMAGLNPAVGQPA